MEYTQRMGCTSQQIREMYDQEASTYDKKTALIERLWNLPRIRKNFLAKANGRVLTVGIGTGVDLPHYANSVELTGIDLSPNMLAIAKKRAVNLGKSVELLQMDAEKLSFEDETFDTVVSTLALCTFSNPDLALREMGRVCKTNGKILLIEHGKSNNSFVAWIQRIFSKRWLQNSGCHLTREPVDLVKKAGLKIQTSKQSFFGIIYTIETDPL